MSRKNSPGYCDAQCPHDVKFIDGSANSIGWTGTKPTGKYGACCAEMDIWEANNTSSAFTAHPCTNKALLKCDNPEQCGDGKQRYVHCL